MGFVAHYAKTTKIERSSEPSGVQKHSSVYAGAHGYTRAPVYFYKIMKYTQKQIVTLLKTMERKVAHLPPPMTTLIIRDYGKDPYLILISCLLSLRARDVITYPVSKELFKYARTPQEMLALSLSKLEKIIQPIGFYRHKAMVLKAVSKELLERFNGKVPKTEEELLSIKHVGIKTANLVLSAAFDISAICVDTHVHRIAHHLGLVSTKTPEETESALKKIIPKAWWGRLNYIFVVWGQNICKPNTKQCRCFEALSS